MNTTNAQSKFACSLFCKYTNCLGWFISVIWWSKKQKRFAETIETEWKNIREHKASHSTRDKQEKKMVFDTRLFIKRIQAFPEIFDTNNAGFKQVDDKNGAWDKIAAEFKVDGEFRWRFIA